MTLRRLTGVPIGSPAPPQEIQFAGTLLLPAIDIDDVSGQVYVGGIPATPDSTAITNNRIAYASQGQLIGDSDLQFDPVTDTVTTGNLTLETGPGKGGLIIGSNPPANATAQGVAGTITWDGGALYVCVNANVWVKVNTATF